MIVLAVLVISTVSVALHRILLHKQYRARLRGTVHERLAEGFFATQLDLTLGAVDNFIVKAVSYVKYSNSTWPFVTIPDFAVKLPNSSVALPPFI
jgi:hypothetical protein